MNERVSVTDRWACDAEAYQSGAEVKTCRPQCGECSFRVPGDALHCRRFTQEMKPRHVLFPSRECPCFEPATPFEPAVHDALESRLYGAVLGFCIGDMLGVPVEFGSRAERERDPVREMRAYGVHHQHFGCWSDDTSLMLCLIDAFDHGFSLERVCGNMVACLAEGKFTPAGRLFDMEAGTREAICRMRDGVAPEACGGARQKDNGSLMRILPLAFVCRDRTPEEIIAMVSRVSSLTHRHARAVLACLIYTVLAAALWEGLGKAEALDRATGFVRTYCPESLAREFPAFDSILSGRLPGLERNDIRSSGDAVETLEAVIWTFMNTDDYCTAVLTAINLGGDTDTAAALTGGLAGMHHGYGALPRRWVQSIARKEMICDMLSAFSRYIREGGPVNE